MTTITNCSFVNEAKKSNKYDVEVVEHLTNAFLEYCKTVRQIGVVSNTSPMVNITQQQEKY